MMTDTMFETLKNVLAENERLFEKLYKVADEYDAIEFDESGFYDDEAERCERHWNTLARKVAEAVNSALEGAEIRLLQNKTPNIRTLHFDVTTAEEEGGNMTTRISVDYATSGQISISRDA
jgi:hypothetical protein